MSKTKERIRDSKLRYEHGLGQNFIYDEDLLQALVASSGISSEDDVLEIGPGSGNMTKYLCKTARTVTAVELDARLIPLIQAFLADADNLTLIHGDVMTVNLHEITAGMQKPFSVVANIPYYITTPLITMLLSSGLPIRRLALMVQKEVADKLLSKPGDDGWGPLAIRAQTMAEVSLAMDVPASCFTPVPKVDSAFVLLEMRDSFAVDVRSQEDFFKLASAAFALRRKTMVNNLCASCQMDRESAVQLVTSIGLDERIRGEKLSLEELAQLSDAYTTWKEQQA